MKVIKKLYIIAFALPMLTFMSTLQANGKLYFKNSGSINVTVVISHQSKAKAFKAAGKTHQTRVEIPAHTKNFIEIGYSDELKNVDITSKEFGTQKLKDMIYNGQTISNGGRFEVFGPCNGAICGRGV